jgi:hypothetical protein
MQCDGAPTSEGVKRLSVVRPLRPCFHVPQVDPLHYVLLFPLGDLGWHDQMPQHCVTDVGHLTQNEYYSNWLHECTDEPLTLLHGGRLFQLLEPRRRFVQTPNFTGVLGVPGVPILVSLHPFPSLVDNCHRPLVFVVGPHNISLSLDSCSVFLLAPFPYSQTPCIVSCVSDLTFGLRI